MRFLVFGILGVALLVALSVAIAFRDGARKVKRESACAMAPLYARNVASFYQASNRFPNTASELADDVFGRTNWAADFTFAVVDESNKTFSIGAIMGSASTVQMRFQLSATGIVQQAVSSP